PPDDRQRLRPAGNDAAVAVRDQGRHPRECRLARRLGSAEAGMTVVSVLRLATRPGKEPDLVRAFAELEIFERSRESGGFLGGRLPRSGRGGPGPRVARAGS